MRTWEEGKVIVFDDSFEHEVWNDSKQERIVLLLNFWHPDLSSLAIDKMLELSAREKYNIVDVFDAIESL